LDWRTNSRREPVFETIPMDVVIANTYAAKGYFSFHMHRSPPMQEAARCNDGTIPLAYQLIYNTRSSAAEIGC